MIISIFLKLITSQFTSTFISRSGNKSTHNIVITMFTPLKLITSYGQTIWVEPTPASLQSCRPLSLMLGKETDDTLKFYYENISSMRKSIKDNQLHVTVKKNECKIKVTLKLTMIYGKMRAILSGLGGAFCMFCICSREEAVDMTLSFSINRTSN
jgi:hypothetical protein